MGLSEAQKDTHKSHDPRRAHANLSALVHELYILGDRECFFSLLKGVSTIICFRISPKLVRGVVPPRHPCFSSIEETTMKLLAQKEEHHVMIQ